MESYFGVVVLLLMSIVIQSNIMWKIKKRKMATKVLCCLWQARHRKLPAFWFRSWSVCYKQSAKNTIFIPEQKSKGTK